MNIKELKIFFWKTFIISAVAFVISVLIILAGYNFFQKIAFTIYHLSPTEFNKVFIYSITFWKILIFQFTLIPAIALSIIDKDKDK